MKISDIQEFLVNLKQIRTKISNCENLGHLVHLRQCERPRTLGSRNITLTEHQPHRILTSQNITLWEISFIEHQPLADFELSL